MLSSGPLIITGRDQRSRAGAFSIALGYGTSSRDSAARTTLATSHYHQAAPSRASLAGGTGQAIIAHIALAMHKGATQCATSRLASTVLCAPMPGLQAERDLFLKVWRDDFGGL